MLRIVPDLLCTQKPYHYADHVISSIKPIGSSSSENSVGDMFLKNHQVFVAAAVLCLVAGFPDHHGHEYAHPKYNFKYVVSDPHTGDYKNQWETRDGDVVKGSYSLLEPDGTIRQVEYTADKHSGFNAVVKKMGKSTHPGHFDGKFLPHF